MTKFYGFPLSQHFDIAIIVHEVLFLLFLTPDRGSAVERLIHTYRFRVNDLRTELIQRSVQVVIALSKLLMDAVIFSLVLKFLSELIFLLLELFSIDFGST